jgi:hypothetical protein
VRENFIRIFNGVPLEEEMSNKIKFKGFNASKMLTVYEEIENRDGLGLVPYIPQNSDLERTRVNVEANEGFFGTILAHCLRFNKSAGSKGFWARACLNYSKKLWNRIISTEPGTFVLQREIASTGGREKLNLIEKGDDISVSNTRVIQIPTFRNVIISNPLLNCLNNLTRFNNDSLIEISKVSKFPESIVRYEQLKDCVNIIEFDIKAMDSTTSFEEILFVFSFLRSRFPKSFALDKIFIYLLSGAVNYFMFLPIGLFAKIVAGTKTGDSFTT